MYCSQCGKEIPESAKFCMFCGEKIEIRSTSKRIDSDYEDKKTLRENDSEITNEESEAKKEAHYDWNELEDSESDFMTEFRFFQNCTVSYCKKSDYVCKYFGKIYAQGILGKQEIEKIYWAAGGIKKAMDDIHQYIGENYREIIEYVLSALAENSIYTTFETFYDKHIAKYVDLYEKESFKSVMDDWFSICEKRDEAISKGGNQAVIDKQMGVELRAFYNNKETCARLADSYPYIVLGAYKELNEILIEKLNLPLRAGIFRLNDAMNLFETVIDGNYPHDVSCRLVAKCIKWFPGEPLFYEYILDDLIADEDSDIMGFLEFWGIDDTFLENMMKKRTRQINIAENGFFDYKFDIRDYENKYIKYPNMASELYLYGEKFSIQSRLSALTELADKSRFIATENQHQKLFAKSVDTAKSVLDENEIPIIYIDQGLLMTSGSNGLMITTDALILLDKADAFKVKYEDIDSITIINSEGDICFNNHRKMSLPMENLKDIGNVITLLQFICLKARKRRNDPEYKIAAYISNNIPKI